MRHILPLGLLSGALLSRSALAFKLVQPKARADQKSEGIVLMHIPYNFGHAVEMEALMPIVPKFTEGVHGGKGKAGHKLGAAAKMNITWGMVNAMKAMKPHAEVWGHLNPDLNVISEVTGCPMYFTPQKYWPKDLARKYFGNKTVFGMLRDPYERLNSFFRGSVEGYGGYYPEFLDTCDVNSAVKAMMKDVLAKNDPFKDTCSFLPQAEYFNGEYGITLPIDNRRFPSSMNEVFDKYGYKLHVKTDRIVHVRGCDNCWSGDFDKETKSLVKQVYKRDFELLCKHFNYCNDEEEVCIPEVPYMCPLNHFEWDKTAMRFQRKVVDSTG